jgi:nucleoside 2-deoxyribosyltransferase
MKQIRSFFLAGVIQGSNTGKTLHDQDYRQRIKSILRRHFPQAKIFDPVEKHPDSVNYDYRTAESVFMGYVKLAADCDCMIAYLPEASMGTAVEMWECYKKGVPVWTISPLKDNWSVKILSTKIFESFEEFEMYLQVNFPQKSEA